MMTRAGSNWNESASYPVIPAKAGTQGSNDVAIPWIPAYAGMTRWSISLTTGSNGPSEAETLWTKSLRCRGLRGVKLVISKGKEGIKAAASKLVNVTWQAGRVVSALTANAFAKNSYEFSKTQRRKVAAQLSPKLLSLPASWTRPRHTCSPM